MNLRFRTVRLIRNALLIEPSLNSTPVIIALPYVKLFATLTIIEANVSA